MRAKATATMFLRIPSFSTGPNRGKNRFQPCVTLMKKLNMNSEITFFDEETATTTVAININVSIGSGNV